MVYLRLGQRIILQELIELRPIVAFPLTSPVYPFVNKSQGLFIECFYSRHVSTDSVVTIVSNQLPPEHLPPHSCFHLITNTLEPLVHPFYLLPKLVLRSFPP